MTVTEYLPLWIAPWAVSCPRCRARDGRPCVSTGGGNYAEVPTHQPRVQRVAHWTDQQRTDAVRLIQQARYTPSALDDDAFAACEAAAAPITAKPVKRLTPKGVRLSEQQAERIECAVHCGGSLSAPTAHFSGDAAWRQTVQALEAKGIVAYVRLSGNGYQRDYRLTAFGWQVYRQHRLIIRRLTDAEVDAAEVAARADLVRRTAAALVVAR
jgi:hypothetical protein